MPSLSIITINLNNAEGLRKTMESVLSQTSRDFEYIIIDGASTDGSIEVIKSFTNLLPGVYSPISTNSTYNESITPCSMPHAPCPMPISYWHSEPDRGIYHAMNKGIRIAKGKYCQFLNSGDWLVAPNVIDKMLTILPDCSIYYGNMLKMMPNGKIYRDTCKRGNLTMLNFYRGTLNHSPALIKRDLFDKYGLYDETLRIVSDWKWYLITIVFNNEPAKYTDFDVTYFDMKGISNTDSFLDKQERRHVLEELLPARILADYDAHWRDIDQAFRINRYKFTRWIFWFIDRCLFKWEKTITD
jgi:glycosyltransferase involved in cell wall biosynthesis